MQTVERTPRIDSFGMDECGEHGFLTVAPPGNLSFSFYRFYTNEGDFAKISYPESGWSIEIKILTNHGANETTQTFFVCPKCGNRIRYIYVNGTRLFCRLCSGLVYGKQTFHRNSIYFFERGKKYAWEKFHYVFPENTAPVDFPNVLPIKPPRMHSQTFSRLMRKFRHYQKQYEKCFYEESAQIINRIEKGD